MHRGGVIFKSPHRDAEIPNQALTPFILARMREFGEKPALIDGASGRCLTYAGLRDAIPRVAAGLHKRGLRKGDVFAIYLPNMPEYAAVFHAVSYLGGIITTVHPRYCAPELRAQLHDTRAKQLITVPELVDTAVEAAGGTCIDQLFVIGEAQGAISYDELLAGSGEPPDVDIDPGRDLVAIPYSSGTTGPPKGVMLSHRNVVANIRQTEGLEDISPDDVLDGVLPFCHIYGMTVIMNCSLALGATVVTHPRYRFGDYLRVLHDYRVTRSYVVPSIVYSLAEEPQVRKEDLSSLRFLLSGAAPLPRGAGRRCAERLGCVVKQGYGLTETSSTTHVDYDDPARVRSESVGPLVRSTECQIIDLSTGGGLGEGQLGEVLVRGPQVMQGYLNNPLATHGVISEDGWLHTGDVGYVDGGGYLYIVDRIKEMIKHKGHQVAPAELEELLMAHPQVRDAAVVPMADEKAGEIPKAYVVREGPIEAEALQRYVAERVAPFKRIREVVFVEEIPKTGTGKPLRRLLANREARER